MTANWKTHRDQYDNLLKAESQPNVLDDDTVNRVIRSYPEQIEFAPIYEKQLKKWQQETEPTSTQRGEIQRLQKQVSQWKQLLTDILDLANELKEGTIERVLSKSDFEVGLEALKRWSNNR